MMKRNFRKVPLQRLEGNFYSFGVISLRWLRFALVLSSLDNNKTIRAPKPIVEEIKNLQKKDGRSIGKIVSQHQNPQAFVWMATPQRIIQEIAKCKEALGTLH